MRKGMKELRENHGEHGERAFQVAAPESAKVLRHWEHFDFYQDAWGASHERT